MQVGDIPDVKISEFLKYNCAKWHIPRVILRKFSGMIGMLIWSV